jgi:uncharacterized protein (DUF736 family)
LVPSSRKTGGSRGKIQTLCIVASLAFVPEEIQNPDAPIFRVFAGRTECGAGMAEDL